MDRVDDPDKRLLSTLLKMTFGSVGSVASAGCLSLRNWTLGKSVSFITLTCTVEKMQPALKWPALCKHVKDATGLLLKR